MLIGFLFLSLKSQQFTYIYILISWILLLITHELLEEKGIHVKDDTTINILPLYNTKQLDPIRFSNSSHMTQKFGRNISDSCGCLSCATFSFTPHLWSYQRDIQQHWIYFLSKYIPPLWFFAEIIGNTFSNAFGKGGKSPEISEVCETN